MKNNIHIFTSSHFSDYEDKIFKENIESTIGTQNFTLEIIKNYNEKSLSQIYTEKLSKTYNEEDIIVFCHSDILFKTKFWGLRLLKLFNKNDYGIIGVAGTKTINSSGMWWENKKSMFGVVEHTDGEKIWVSEYSKKTDKIEPVVSVDGLFMSIDPQKIKTPVFKEYSKFHFYDVPFCLSNFLLGTNIGVTTDIRILHKSVGQINSEWEKGRISFIEEYKTFLPASIIPHHKNVNIKLKKTPKVTVIIPTKNNFEILFSNLTSWNEKSTYNNVDFIIADTGSNNETLSNYPLLPISNLKIIKYDYYNFAKINNDVVKNHIPNDTELLLFCNDDIELLNDVLTICVDLYNKNEKNVGTIGIRLHYSNGAIQHEGIKIKKIKNEHYHITHRNLNEFFVNQNTDHIKTLGNTGAFLLINKNLFIECNGFNENYIECFEDVELNVKCLTFKKINLTSILATAYHYESLTRNKNIEKNKKTLIDYNNLLKPFIYKNETYLKKLIE